MICADVSWLLMVCCYNFNVLFLLWFVFICVTAICFCELSLFVSCDVFYGYIMFNVCCYLLLSITLECSLFVVGLCWLFLLIEFSWCWCCMLFPVCLSNYHDVSLYSYVDLLLLFTVWFDVCWFVLNCFVFVLCVLIVLAIIDCCWLFVMCYWFVLIYLDCSWFGLDVWWTVLFLLMCCLFLCLSCLCIDLCWCLLSVCCFVVNLLLFAVLRSMCVVVVLLSVMSVFAYYCVLLCCFVICCWCVLICVAVYWFVLTFDDLCWLLLVVVDLFIVCWFSLFCVDWLLMFVDCFLFGLINTHNKHQQKSTKIIIPTQTPNITFGPQWAPRLGHQRAPGEQPGPLRLWATQGISGH